MVMKISCNPDTTGYTPQSAMSLNSNEFLEFIGDEERIENDNGGESTWSSINKVLKLVENWSQFDLKL